MTSLRARTDVDVGVGVGVGVRARERTPTHARTDDDDIVKTRAVYARIDRLRDASAIAASTVIITNIMNIIIIIIIRARRAPRVRIRRRRHAHHARIRCPHPRATTPRTHTPPHARTASTTTMDWRDTERTREWNPRRRRTDDDDSTTVARAESTPTATTTSRASVASSIASSSPSPLARPVAVSSANAFACDAGKDRRDRGRRARVDPRKTRVQVTSEVRCRRTRPVEDASSASVVGTRGD
jgi:hypothetical protein